MVLMLYTHIQSFIVSFNNKDNLDCILPGANYTETDEASCLDLIRKETVPTLCMPELLGTVESPTHDTVSTEGITPREGRAFVRDLLFVFHMQDINDLALNPRPGLYC